MAHPGPDRHTSAHGLAAAPLAPRDSVDVRLSRADAVLLASWADSRIASFRDYAQTYFEGAPPDSADAVTQRIRFILFHAAHGRHE